MYTKNFDLWNEDKKNLEGRNVLKLICKKRQIWLCKIGENLGNEIGKGKPFIRPVLILNTRFGGDLILVIPLTTKYSERYDRFFYKLNSEIGLNFDSYLLLNQVKVVSKKRLLNKVIDDIGISFFQDIILKLEKIIRL